MENPDQLDISPTIESFEISWTPTRQYRWKPKEDITVHELAQCMPMIGSSLYYSIGSNLVEDLPDNCKRHFELIEDEDDEVVEDEEVRRIKTTKYISSHDEMRFRMKDKSGIYLGEKYIGRTIDAIEHFMDEAKAMGLEKVTIDYWENREDRGEPDGYFGWENDSKEPIILGAGDESVKSVNSNKYKYNIKGGEPQSVDTMEPFDIVGVTEEKRFYSDKERLDGYFAIYDRQDEYEIIWVDCSEDKLLLFVDALNRDAEERQ